MKGSFKTAETDCYSTRTNFDDWSDEGYKLPTRRVEKMLADDKKLRKLTLPTPNNPLKTVVSQTTENINQLREKIRKGQPLLSKKEIRNVKLPFHESLLQNLKDDGFLLTYEFIGDLIAVDDAYHKYLESDFSLKNRKILKYNPSILNMLSDGLSKAENARLNEQKIEEATVFLDLATFFADHKDTSWHWVAQEMFEQCMEVVENFDAIDLQLKAKSKHIYASFLFHELHELNEAKTQVEGSMVISEGKYWTIDDTKEMKGNILYFESCALMHKILLEMAQEHMIDLNTEEAIQLCRNALQWAKIMNKKSAEVHALNKLIQVYLSANQLNPVQELLQNYMKLCTELKDFEGLCEGHILFAAYHDSAGDKGAVIEDIKDLLKVAQENNIANMVAVAHHKLAIFCMKCGREKELLEHAVEAYMYYVSLNSKQEMEETRCQVGIAQALEIMPDYCNLVVEADNYNVELSILILWKNLRIPFFAKELLLIPETLSNVGILDKVESLRNEEVAARVNNRETDLVSLTSTRMRSLKLHSIVSSTSQTTKGANTIIHVGSESTF